MASVHYKISDLANIGYALDWVQSMIERGIKAGPVVVTMGRETRNLQQNALLWALLGDISKQVEWFGKKHSPEVWKDIVTGSWRNCQFVPNLEGTGLVAVGLSTSRLSKKEFADLIEYILCFCADKGVKLSGESEKKYNDFEQEKRAA